MYKLIDTGKTPSCGWNYKSPHTDVVIKGKSFDDLVKKVRANLELNNVSFDPTRLVPEIMDDLCKRSITGTCEGFINWFVNTARTVMNGTNALAIMIRRGEGAFVPHQLAEERAKNCASCIYNVSNPGCITCKGFKTIIDSARRGRTTTLDGELNTCGICGCFIQALVHVDADILRITTPRKMLKYYPDSCWKKLDIKEITNEQKK